MEIFIMKLPVTVLIEKQNQHHLYYAVSKFYHYFKLLLQYQRAKRL